MAGGFLVFCNIWRRVFINNTNDFCIFSIIILFFDWYVQIWVLIASCILLFAWSSNVVADLCRSPDLFSAIPFWIMFFTPEKLMVWWSTYMRSRIVLLLNLPWSESECLKFSSYALVGFKGLTYLLELLLKIGLYGGGMSRTFLKLGLH